MSVSFINEPCLEKKKTDNKQQKIRFHKNIEFFFLEKEKLDLPVYL